MKRKSLMLAITIAMSTTLVASAAEHVPNYSLDQLTVTATRSMKNIQQIPASVSVITEQDINNHNFQSVAEAMQYLPGVYLNQNSQGGITMRGFDSSNILVLVDGLPVNSTYNNKVNWETIPVNNIKRIEVVRGAGSSLYGGRAVAGVVQIITKKPLTDSLKDDKINGDVNIKIGSHNEKNYGVNINTALSKKIGLGIHLNKNSNDGFKTYYNKLKLKKTTAMPNDAKPLDRPLPQLSDGNYIFGTRGERKWSSNNIGFDLEYKLDKNKRLMYHFNHNESTYRYINPESYLYIDGKNVFDAKIKFDANHFSEVVASDFLGYDGLKKSNSHELNYTDNDNKFSLRIGFYDVVANGYSSPDKSHDINYDGPGDNSSYPGKTYNFDIQKAFKRYGKHLILTGLNYREESFAQERSLLKHWRDKSSLADNYKGGVYAEHGGKGRTLALFVQDEVKVNDKLTTYLGLRMDHYKKYDGYSRFYDANGALDKKESAVHKSGTYTEFSPKLGLEYVLDRNTNIYASYGHSFNPAPLYNVYRYGGSGMGEVIPNPNINPEKSDTFELGIKKKLSSKTNIDLATYYIKTKDKIEYVSHYNNANKIDYKQYQNVGSEKRKGIELNLTHKFNDRWSTYINYAWQEGKIYGLKTTSKANSINYDKDKMEIAYEIPKHIFHGGVNYRHNKWDINLDMQYVSKRQAPNVVTGEYGSQDAYFLTNLAVNYKLREDASIQLAVNNILDRHFYSGEGTDGRTYAIGLKYSF